MSPEELQKLIDNCLSGDQKSMRILFDYLIPKVNSTCHRYLKNDADLQEAVQETMIRIFKYLSSYDSNKGEFLGWAYRFAVNESLRLIKKNKKFKHDELDSTDLEDVDGNIINSDSYLELRQLIGQLKDSYSIVFNLYYIEGYSHKEIADMLDIKETSSRTIYFRAKNALRDLYLKNNF